MENDIYFSNLKSVKNIEDDSLKFPNLQNFNINENILTYKNTLLDVSILEFKLLNPIIFTFNEEEFFRIVKNTLINTKDRLINDGEEPFYKKQANYILELQKLKTLNEEEKRYILEYLEDYFFKKTIKEKYNFEELNQELEIRINPISEAYMEDNIIGSNYNNPACILIRDFENHHYQTNNVVLQYQGPVLVRTKKSMHPSSYEVDSFKETGFISSFIILALTVALGIIISFILH